jgi:hypothetical protein
MTMARETSPQRIWFCPACGGQLSYGTYCKVCETETTFSFRPATEAELRAHRLSASRARWPGDGELPADATPEEVPADADA